MFPEELSDQVDLALRRFKAEDGSTAEEICLVIMDRAELSLTDRVVLAHILRKRGYEQVALQQYERALRAASDPLQGAFIHGELGFCYYTAAQKAKNKRDAKRVGFYYALARNEFVRACGKMNVKGQLRPLLYLTDVLLEQGEFAKAGHVITQYIDSGCYSEELEQLHLRSFAFHLRGKYVYLTGKVPER